MATTLTQAQLSTAKALVGFLSPPLPMNSAIAVTGNVAQECAFDPTLAGDGGVSKFWMQWQGSRLTNYEAWCTENRLAPTAPQAIQFFNYELPTPDGAPLIVSWLMDTSNGGQPSRSIATLTADICQFYERAGTPDMDNRIAYSQQVQAFMGANPLPSNPSTPIVPAAPTPPVTPTTPASPVTPTTPDPSTYTLILLLIQLVSQSIGVTLSIPTATIPITPITPVVPTTPTAPISSTTPLAGLNLGSLLGILSGLGIPGLSGLNLPSLPISLAKKE